MTLLGNKAPLFKAPAVINGKDIVQDFSLAQFVNQKEVIFFFYPKDFTFVCPTELIAFQDKLEAFERRGVAIVGCSTDTEETHLAWLSTPRNKGGIQGITYPMVADVSKTITANNGVLGGTWAYDEQDNMVFQNTPKTKKNTKKKNKQKKEKQKTNKDQALGR